MRSNHVDERYASPWAILAELEHEDDDARRARLAGLWSEFVEATRGARWVAWCNEIRNRLDLKGESDVEDTGKAVPVAMVPEEIKRDFLRHPTLRGEVLDAIELDCSVETVAELVGLRLGAVALELWRESNGQTSAELSSLIRDRQEKFLESRRKAREATITPVGVALSASR